MLYVSEGAKGSRRIFFFEKKKQKTFIYSGSDLPAAPK
jgi:hypothetical protein